MFQRSNSALRPETLNASFLEDHILYFTDRQRQRRGMAALTVDPRIRTAARTHSQNMARLQFFSHDSPVPSSRTLEDRMTNAGIKLNNSMFAENLGVDFFLKIADVPFYQKREHGRIVYYHAKTNAPIPYQSYSEFAAKMVDSLMASPHHRENILNGHYTTIGIGAAAGKYREMEAVYITQNFWGPLS